MVANEGGGERAAKTAGDKELRDGLDGVPGSLVQLCGLLAAAKSKRRVVNCKDQLEDEFSFDFVRQDSNWTNPPIRYGRVFVNTSAYAMWTVINCILVFGFGVSGEVYVLFCCLGHVY